MLTDAQLKKTTSTPPLRREDNLVYRAHEYVNRGPASVGTVNTRRGETRWVLSYDPGTRIIRLVSDAQISHNLGRATNTQEVTQISFAFDSSGNVVWCYSYIDTTDDSSNVSLFKWTRTGNTKLVDIVGATSPTVTHDLLKNIGVAKYAASILVVYNRVVDSSVGIRHSDDTFQTERVLNTVLADEFIIGSGLTKDQRVNVTTRRQAGYVSYKSLLTPVGGLLLDSEGNPLWVSHPKRNTP